jgi:glycosyltransferase involved in cell wall biosynthesis
MPVLEAMGCGTAVLCSTGAAIPEVAGDGAWLVEPTSLNDWARAFERVLTEPAFKEVLREKGRARSTHFRIDHIAQQTLNALKSIVPGHA